MPQENPTLAHQSVTGEILKAFFDVYRELGCGFSEIVYRRALGIVLRSSGLEAVEEFPLEVRFRGTIVGRFHADMIVARAVLVETKASATFEEHAQAQTLNYLKAAGGGSRCCSISAASPPTSGWSLEVSRARCRNCGIHESLG